MLLQLLALASIAFGSLETAVGPPVAVGMLILTRRVGETLIIGDDVTVYVLGVNGNQVRIGVNAPKEVSVLREEIYKRIKEERERAKRDLTGEERDVGSSLETAVGMLILTRKVGEALVIGDDVTVTVLGVKGNKVRIGVNAPKEVSVYEKDSTGAAAAEATVGQYGMESTELETVLQDPWTAESALVYGFAVIGVLVVAVGACRMSTKYTIVKRDPEYTVV